MHYLFLIVKVLKRKFKNFALQVIQCAKILLKMGLTSRDWIEKKIFSEHPYFRENSEKFIKAVKRGDMDAITKLLK